MSEIMHQDINSRLLAMDAETALYQVGAKHVRFCPDSAEAQAEIAMQRPDCAVLDLYLGSDTSFEIADVLAAQGVPFIFMTGVSDVILLPERFRDIPIVSKPVLTDVMIKQLVSTLSAAGRHTGA